LDVARGKNREVAGSVEAANLETAKRRACRSPLLGAERELGGGRRLLFSALFPYQPKINPNSGVAAYTPPPGTRLIPLPRRSDAPELVDLPADLPSALSALAQAQTSDQHAKADARPPARKRPRADPGEYDQRKVGFGQQWNFGHSGWSNSGWNNNRSWSSNSRSWF
jgi:hypothetical protein